MSQADFVLCPDPIVSELCTVCNGVVSMQIFKNTGVCCELHRKVRDGEITKEQADVQGL